MNPKILSIIVICLLAACQHKPKANNVINSKVKDTADAAVSRLRLVHDSLKSIDHKLTPKNRKDYILTIDQQRISPIKDTLDYTIKKGYHKQSYVNVPMLLENRSADTLKYFIMTCSEWDVFRVNNMRLSYFDTICESNFPEVRKIAPKQSESFNIPLKVSRREGGTRTFKIGMSLQLYIVGEYLDPYKNMTDPNAPNTIWSNQVNIP